MEVWISYEFSYRGGVEFTLESPSGTQSKLLTRRKFDTIQNSALAWTFMTVQHWGENPDGKWKLTMSLPMDRSETGNMTKYFTQLLIQMQIYSNNKVMSA